MKDNGPPSSSSPVAPPPNDGMSRLVVTSVSSRPHHGTTSFVQGEEEAPKRKTVYEKNMAVRPRPEPPISSSNSMEYTTEFEHWLLQKQRNEQMTMSIEGQLDFVPQPRRVNGQITTTTPAHEHEHFDKDCGWPRPKSRWTIFKTGENDPENGSKYPQSICLDKDGPSVATTSQNGRAGVVPKLEIVDIQIDQHPPHGDERQCQICGGTWPSVQSLRVHLMTHQTIVREYGTISENRAENGSKNMDTFKEPVQQTPVKGQPKFEFECKWCGRRFQQRKIYEGHLTNFHPTLSRIGRVPIVDKGKKRRKIIAEKCPFGIGCQGCKFLMKKETNPQLLPLPQSQSGPRPRSFACRYCECAFYEKQHQKEHERSHKGEQPYPCPYCPVRFSLARNRSRHIQNRHQNQ